MSEERPPIAVIDYRNPAQGTPPPRSKGGRNVLVWSIVALGAVVLLVLMLLPSLGRAREQANRVKCASNLRQIGQAAMMYANEHGGQLPPDLLTLYQDQDLTPEMFVCPSSDLDRATGATTQQITSSMVAGDHLGYAWAGAGGRMTGAGTTDVVIAFDMDPHLPKDSAPGTGINVLLADGSAVFVDAPTAKAVRAQFIAGVRPIRLRPASTAGGASRPAPPWR
jgi:competence protein ComGC